MDMDTMDVPSDDAGFDEAMEPVKAPTLAELQAHRLRDNGFAVVVTRTNAQGIPTEEFLASGDFLATVREETSRCSGRSNCYSDITLLVPGERGDSATEAFAKVGPSGVLGLPIAERASHQRKH